MKAKEKCMASREGICQNVYAFGVRCNGYSQDCKLRPAYLSLEKVFTGLAENVRRAYGIVGDKK